MNYFYDISQFQLDVTKYLKLKQIKNNINYTDIFKNQVLIKNNKNTKILKHELKWKWKQKI